MGFLLLFLVSCRKEGNTMPPTIAFKTGPGYVSHDTTLQVGETILVGIDAAGEGANLTYFHVGIHGIGTQTFLDSGMNQPSLRYDLSITKTAGESELWRFLVMDRDRNVSQITLTLLRDSVTLYGPIRTITDLILGAQGNISTGSFYSLLSERSYFLDEASLAQDSIDMIYYFDQYDATLASPAEADAPVVFSGPTGIATWTVKNETRFDSTAIDPVAFDQSINDSLILAAYEPVNLKRKAKYIHPGTVISFRDPRGKLGLILIKEVIPGPSGSVTLDLKIQE